MKSQITALFKYGLDNLIAGKTPTFSGWTVNPTDAADITDGDINTFCTTGNKVAAGGWQYAYLIWDLGAFYNILCTGVGGLNVTAGNRVSFISFWDGSAWVTSNAYAANNPVVAFSVSGGVASQVRLGIASSAAATITPNIREFNVWRLK